jgi:hypothetical protein
MARSQRTVLTKDARPELRQKQESKHKRAGVKRCFIAVINAQTRKLIACHWYRSFARSPFSGLLEIDETHAAVARASHTNAIGRVLAGQYLEIWFIAETNQGREAAGLPLLEAGLRRELVCAMVQPADASEDDMRENRNDLIRRFCLTYIKPGGGSTLYTDGNKVYNRVAAILQALKYQVFHAHSFKAKNGANNNTAESRQGWGKFQMSRRYRANAEWIEREWNFYAWYKYTDAKNGGVFNALLELLCEVYGPGDEASIPGEPKHHYKDSAIPQPDDYDEEAEEAYYDELMGRYEQERREEEIEGKFRRKVRNELKKIRKQGGLS